MKFSKDDYILRNFSKIKHKSWELYVITRIIHLLNDPEIEFVCQQLIRTPNMKRYLADLCFPALELYIEIDELHHTKNQNQIDDEHRKREIIDAINFDEKRIKVFDGQNKIRKLNEINDEILEVIEELKDRKKKLKKSGKFIPWNYEKKFSPEPHLERGYIDVKDNVVFLNHRDVLRCFGYKKGGHFQGATWGIKGKNKYVWFPKLYKNDLWNNSLSDDTKKIIMKLDSGKSLVDWMEERGDIDYLGKIKSGDSASPVVFAHYKNLLGQTVYKFLGEFKVSSEESDEFSTISNRTRTKVYLS